MSKKKIVFFIILISILAVAVTVVLVFYFQGVSRYKERFFKGTRINGVDCSDLSPEAVCSILDAQINDYVLEVCGRDPRSPQESAVLGRITPKDVALCRKDTARFVEQIFQRQNPYEWYKIYEEEWRDYTFLQEITFESEMLQAFVDSWDACVGDIAVEPQDAYLSEYLPEENAYRVIPDTIGSKMDSHKALPAIEKALYSMENQVDIECTGCYNSAKIKADDEALNALADQLNSMLGATIHYNWYGTEFTVGREQLGEWVSLQEGEPVLDEEAVVAFVKEAKKQYDPYGHSYLFRTSLGAEVKLKVKSGWVSDPEKEAQELIALIKEGAVTERRPVSSTQDYVFFDGTIGDSYAEVDLTNQHMYFYYQGELFLETDFVSGDVATGHATPEGIYAVTYKQKNRVLRGPDYESFVYFWMPFYGGYGMHDATWRRTFGGSIYLENGSHGCVNLPKKIAEKIYNCVETGFPVICYYYPQGKNPKDRVVAEAAGSAVSGEGQGNAGQVINESLTGNAGQAVYEGLAGNDGTAENGDPTGSDGQTEEGGDQTEENEIRGRW